MCLPHTFVARVPAARPSPPRPSFCARRAPACTAEPPSRRRVRVPRRHTAAKPGWEWRGASSPPRAWCGLFAVDEAVRKALDALWAKGVAEGSLLARMTALGAAVLKSVSDALERTLYPDTEKELVVEYGLTDPSPADKTYVDPLREWDTSPETYYRDSFGRRVYLQLHGATGLVAAADYRDQFDESGEQEEDGREGDAQDDGATHVNPQCNAFSILGEDDVLDSADEPAFFKDLPHDPTAP